MKKAEQTLKDWDLTDANDAELYNAFFNFYTVKSMDAATPLAKTKYDIQYSKQALEYITEGIERFPTRIDMRIAKIYMLGELNNYKDYVSEILALITYSDKIKNNWKQEGFTSVSYPEDIFFGIVTEGQGLLFSKEDPSLFNDIIRISEEMIKYYPKHNQSYLACSTVYIAQKKYDKSLEMLLKVFEFEPENPIILFNIAYVYHLKGEKPNAKRYYELTIKHCGEKEDKLKEAANSRLKGL
jgi:tetratricopeptide (TPR) repeat protein